MKKIFILSLLFFSILCNAKFIKATIVFHDGHSETGLIKSFLEEKLINLSLTESLEHELNLDDKFLKFKINENSEIKIVTIDDINEVDVDNDNGTSTIYKVILLKEISAKGKVLDKSRKVFLPLIRKGKINIYGIKFKEITKDFQSTFTSRGTRFYYQRQNENYAINFYNFDNETILFNIKNRIIIPLRLIFNDCPEITKDLDFAFDNFSKGDKNAKKEYKELQKEFQKLPNAQQEDLNYIHIYQYNFAEKLIERYELCN